MACTEIETLSKEEALADEEETALLNEMQQEEDPSPDIQDLNEDNTATNNDTVILAPGCSVGFKGDQCEILDYNNPPNQFKVQVDKNGVARTFNLKKYDARNSLKVKVVEVDSSVTVPTLPSTSPQYIGSCEEESSAIVSATILPNGSLRYAVSNSDGLNDWAFIPDEETNPNAAINAYSLLKTVPKAFTPTLFPGASYITPEKGGLTRDGTTYQSHLGFIITKDYVDTFTGDLNTILRKAETTVTQMNAHNMRDILLESKVSEILVTKDATPDGRSARTDFDTYTMDNTSNTIYAIGNFSGGFAYGCHSGGDPALGAEHTDSVGNSSPGGDGTWYNVMRHEYGHSLGSEHFPGKSPEGPTIMSGNAKAKFSSDEILNLEWCYANIGVNTLKASTPPAAFSQYPIPPLARLDKPEELGQTGEVIIDVLANDHDINGDRIAIAGFDSTSAIGASISFVPADQNHPRDRLKYQAASEASFPDTCGTLCSSTDLLLWLDASDKTTLIDTGGNSGNALSHLAPLKTWKDKSSHTNDADVYAASNKPEIHLQDKKLIGGLPVVHFDGDLMEIRSLDLSEATHPEITTFAVAQHDDGTIVIWAAKSTQGSRRSQEAAPGVTTIGSLVYDTKQYTERFGMFDTTTKEISLKPMEPGVALGHAFYSADGVGDYPSTLSLAELLIFNRKMNDAERKHIETYLVKKWSLGFKDSFTYTITDETGRTSQGFVKVPRQYVAKSDLSAWDGKLFNIRNRKDCASASGLCDWHLSWFNSEAQLTDVNNTVDLVPWKLTLVPGTTNQFYIANNWGCPGDSRCNLSLQFVNNGDLNLVDTNHVVPFEINLVPGTDGPGMIKEYTIRNRFQCDSNHLRCNAPVNFSAAGRIRLEFQYRDPIPWSIEEVIP